jgi:hypothetical protein
MGKLAVELHNPAIWWAPPWRFGRIAIASLRELLGWKGMEGTSLVQGLMVDDTAAKMPEYCPSLASGLALAKDATIWSNGHWHL